MTNKAKKLFDFIQRYIQKNGIAPSFDEMTNFMGLILAKFFSSQH